MSCLLITWQDRTGQYAEEEEVKCIRPYITTWVALLTCLYSSFEMPCFLQVDIFVIAVWYIFSYCTLFFLKESSNCLSSLFMLVYCPNNTNSFLDIWSFSKVIGWIISSVRLFAKIWCWFALCLVSDWCTEAKGTNASESINDTRLSCIRNLD